MTPDDLFAVYVVLLLSLLCKRYGCSYPLLAALLIWGLIKNQLSH